MRYRNVVNNEQTCDAFSEGPCGGAVRYEIADGYCVMAYCLDCTIAYVKKHIGDYTRTLEYLKKKKEQGDPQ